MKRAFMARLLGIVLTALVLATTGCSSSSGASADKKIVLVAGATGGTGRALVRGLGAQGYAGAG